MEKQSEENIEEPKAEDLEAVEESLAQEADKTESKHVEHHEHVRMEEPVKQEQEESSTKASAEPTKPQEQEESSKKSSMEPAKPHEHEGSQKRASIVEPPKESISSEPKIGASVDQSQDTFIPPAAKGARSASMSSSSEKKRSSFQGKRGSMGVSDRNLMPSPSGARKSKFGGLTSRAKMVLGSIVDIKANLTGDFFDKKVAKFQNTYKLDSDNPFNPEKVYNILQEVMQEALENLPYDPERCPSQAKWASNTIRSKIKQLEYDRYKLVCIVSIGEKNSQDVYATCRFLWDNEKDRFSTYSLENTNVYGIAYCFGLYYE